MLLPWLGLSLSVWFMPSLRGENWTPELWAGISFGLIVLGLMCALPFWFYDYCVREGD